MVDTACHVLPKNASTELKNGISAAERNGKPDELVALLDKATNSLPRVPVEIPLMGVLHRSWIKTMLVMVQMQQLQHDESQSGF